MRDSIWFTTRTGLFKPGEEAWNEVARYAEPILRLLARRYRWLSLADREDLMQDILIEMKESLVTAHDRSRGRFRALLQTVVKRRVVDRLRKARPESLGEDAQANLGAPPEAEVEALDLETGLLEAVEACRDRFTQGKLADMDVLYAIVDKLVNGLSNVEIARKNGVSRDRVMRLLARGRDAIFRQLLARELEVAAEDKRLDAVVTVFKACLRQPRRRADHVADIKDAELREGFETFLDRFHAALPLFRGDRSFCGEELGRGIELILG